VAVYSSNDACVKLCRYGEYGIYLIDLIIQTHYAVFTQIVDDYVWKGGILALRTFLKGEGIPIAKNKLVKIKRMRNVIEIVHLDKRSTGFNSIKKLSKTEYMNLATGEIMTYNLSKTKAENIASLKKTFRRARDLINNNFEGKKNELHVTLTYRENMTDTKQLYKDFEAFWKRFKRKYGSDIDYLSIVEPQERGAWHCHVLIRFNGEETVFIPNDEIATVWKQGFTKTKTTAGIDNMGAYITAYLTDIELPDHISVEDASLALDVKTVEIEGKSKSFVKGARMQMYPSNMNIVRSSKGIKPPSVEEMSYKNAKKIVGDATPNYSMTTTVCDGDKTLNQITYEQYNLKRRCSKSE